MRSSKLTRRLALAAGVSICLAGWGLNGVFASLNLSPGHLRLIKALRSQAAQTETSRMQASTKVAVKQEQVDLQPAGGAVKPAAKGSRRVYRELTSREREALLAGLRRKVGTMPVGDFRHDQAALAGYKNLMNGEQGTKLTVDDGTVVIPDNAIAEVEPNGDWPSAQALALGDTLAGKAVPFEDIDVYSFEATAGQYVRIEALPVGSDNINGSGYAIVRLFDPDSTQVYGGFYVLYDNKTAQPEDIASRIVWPGGSLVAASLEKDGTYYVVVEMYPGNIRWLDGTTNIVTDGQYNEIAYRLTVDELETTEVDGLVKDDRGAAIEGASVALWSQDGIGGARAVSDENGRFSTALPAGVWGVNIEAPVGSPYPSGQELKGIEVSGSTVSVEFTLRRGVVFSGRIETDRQETAPYVGFSMVGTDYRQYRWGQSDEEGNFSVAVFPDTFDIYLQPGYLYPPQPVIEGVQIVADTSTVIVLDSGVRISGRLLDGDGNPVPNTWVNFSSDMLYRSVYTSSDGKYAINLQEGTYWANVQPAVSLLVPAQEVGPLELNADRELDIELQSGGLLGGLVYDDRGNPVAGALVNVWTVPDNSDPGTVTDSIIRSADGTIYYNETGDPSYPDLVDPTVGISAGYQPKYFQMNTDENGAWRMALLEGGYTVDFASPYPYPSQRYNLGSITVQEGSEVDAGKIVFAYGVVFSGQVTVDGKQPLAWSGFQMTSTPNDSIVYFSDGSTSPIRAEPVVTKWVNTDENGEFSAQVMPGTYNLLFDPANSRLEFPRQWVRDVELTADTRMDIPLEPGQTVSGMVVNEDGKGLAGSRLDFYDSDGTWQGMAVCVDNGEFSLVLAAGDYNLVVTPVRGYFADSSSYAVSVPSATQIEIIARSGVRVYGRVTAASDGHPLGGVTVQLLPQFGPVQNATGRENQSLISMVSYLAGDDSSANGGQGVVIMPYPLPAPQPNQYTTSSDYDGNWELIVRSGVYDIYATPSMYGFANAFLPAVDCSAEKQLDLMLAEVEIVFEGRVTDEAGQPAPGTLVSLFDPNNGGQVSAFTDENGHFRLDLPMGDYEMFIEGPAGSNSLPTSDHLKLDEDRQVLIQLGHGLLEDQQPDSRLPRAFVLGQNVPNPFNPSTTISYALDEQARVNLSVYDLRGRTVAVLVDRVQDEGDYNVQWDGTDRAGRQLSSGIYMYRLQAGTYQMTRKMVLIK